MTDDDKPASDTPANRFPVIRRIGFGAIPLWLHAGWQDFRQGGVASLFYAGVYEDQAIDRGLDYLMQTSLPTGTGSALGQAHYFYGHYYAVQAMYLTGGEAWAKWWPAIRKELLTAQNDDGSWSDPSVGDVYGTSMAMIILQMPKRYLPIFQK